MRLKITGTRHGYNDKNLGLISSRNSRLFMKTPIENRVLQNHVTMAISRGEDLEMRLYLNTLDPLPVYTY
jgi:hypothetical protein